MQNSHLLYNPIRLFTVKSLDAVNVAHFDVSNHKCTEFVLLINQLFNIHDSMNFYIFHRTHSPNTLSQLIHKEIIDTIVHYSIWKTIQGK